MIMMDMAMIMSNNSNNNNNNNTASRRMDEPFPLKLHRLLDDVENTPQADILCWDPDGRSFTVLKPKQFAETIMGQYFRQTKYKSFQRQMNLYGFTREVRGKIRGVYSHPRFIRHERDLCLSIKRSSKTPSSPKLLSSPSSSSSSSLASLKGAVTKSAASSSIDVSSPLFAPFPPPSQTNTMMMTMMNNNNIMAMGIHKPLLPNNNNKMTLESLVPSFTFPPGGLKSLVPPSSRRVSVEDHNDDDDEDSMGTIDDLPTMMNANPFPEEGGEQEFGTVAV